MSINVPDLAFVRDNILEYTSGADPVIHSVTDDVMNALSLACFGLNHPRPVGSFFLTGPTGSGKTHYAESVAKALHGEPRVLRIACGEYQHDHEIAKLVGAPPGYLGHRETQPRLAQTQANAATSDRCNVWVFLVDEIEKASPALFDILLGILDKGELRLGDNAVVRFGHALIFFTSNLGAALGRTPGFGKQSEAAEVAFKRRVTEHFRPEFINRLTAIHHYPQITRDGARTILLKLWAAAGVTLGERGISLRTMTKLELDKLVNSGYSQEYGSRELRRVFEREFLTPFLNTLGAPPSAARRTSTRTLKGRV